MVFLTKKVLFGYFWVRISKKKQQKNYCHVWNRHPPICLIAKFYGKTKMPNFKTKNVLHGYLSPKMPYLGISGQELKKSYCQTWNQHLEKRQFPKSYQETTRLSLRTKNAWFGYFWAGIWKECYNIWIQHLEFSVIAKFCQETKMSKFGSKNAWFVYFWPKMLSLRIFGVEF